MEADVAGRGPGPLAFTPAPRVPELPSCGYKEALTGGPTPPTPVQVSVSWDADSGPNPRSRAEVVRGRGRLKEGVQIGQPAEKKLGPRAASSQRDSGKGDEMGAH